MSWRCLLATEIVWCVTDGMFLWRYAKDREYVDKLLTLQYLKVNVRQGIAEIPSNLCLKMDKNYLKLIEVCKSSQGGYLNCEQAMLKFKYELRNLLTNVWRTKHILEIYYFELSSLRVFEFTYNADFGLKHILQKYYFQYKEYKCCS